MNGWASIRTGCVKCGALIKLKYEVCIYKLLCFQDGYSRVLQSVGTSPGIVGWYQSSTESSVLRECGSDDRNEALNDE